MRGKQSNSDPCPRNISSAARLAARSRRRASVGIGAGPQRPSDCRVNSGQPLNSHRPASVIEILAASPISADLRPRPLLCAVLGVVLFAASAVGTVASPKPGQARTAPLFEFHSNFWVNLHQALFHEALVQIGKPDRRLQSNEPLTAPQMTEQERADWKAAVGFYEERFGSRQELFDLEMVHINDQLATGPDDGTTPHAAGPLLRVVSILESVAPIYRKYWWSAHNRSNEDWILSQTTRVKSLGPKIAAAMERDLRQRWPVAPLRVDLCYYVPQIGHAYTTDGPPPHTTFSSSGTQLQDLSGFETLFHEASHSFASTMTDALFAECEAQKKECGELWHAVLFYTAGVETGRALGSADRENFTPYAYRYGLYDRGDYPKYRRVLETDWQAYLDGKIDFATAIRSLVGHLQ
jgi:hypothetical protein